MDLTGKKVLILGMGVSGKGVAKLLKSARIPMVLYDGNSDLDKDALRQELGLDASVPVITGELQASDFAAVDILALSPGISINAPYVKMAQEAGAQILGELEIAYELCKGHVIAITGTNGKTTTTALTGAIMEAAEKSVFVVGNIGTSFASVAMDTTEESVIVAEVSSFQLESVREFHPCISAVLNLTPDHLDRHGSFENYALCKMKIAGNQIPGETCVINYDDSYLRSLAEDLKPDILYFSRCHTLQKGVFLQGDDIVYADGEHVTMIMNRHDMNLMGDHNVENVMAAIGIALAWGVPVDTIRRVVRDFQAVEHRIEFVCTKEGVSYYNDSKGTNTDAAAKAVDSMVAPTVLIAGGYDKGADFTEWIRGFHGKIRDMVLIGQTAEKIRETALKCGFTSIHMEGDLAHAVKKAAELAEAGDAVLLSPACASWDQFKSYEERGRLFKELVRDL